MKLARRMARGDRWSHIGLAEDGMSTAEYAIGTVAACGFAAVLLKLLTSSEVADLLRSVVRHAFSFAS
jgi:hypothetical protein